MIVNYLAIIGMSLCVFLSPGFSSNVFAQLQSTAGPTPEDENGEVSMQFSLSTNINNDTLKPRESAIKSAANAQINLISALAKTGDTEQLFSKAKILNQLNNLTQTVEGSDAINAIIGVEVGKALRSVIDEAGNLTKDLRVTMDFDSECRHSTASSVMCNYNLVFHK